MAELLLVTLLVGALVAAATTLYWLAWSWLLWGGVGLIVCGLLVGVPTGALYHLRLRAVLAAEAALPARWWLHPTALHGDIPPPRRRWVMWPFYVGAAGFFAIVLGCGVMCVGFLRSPWGGLSL